MVLLVLLVLALFVIQTLLPGRFREPAPGGGKSKLVENLGNRDHMRPLTVVGERASRALANMHEALPVFLALALLNLIVGTAADSAVTGATVFLIARTLYVAIYMAGIPVVRTLVWAVGWVGLAMMVAPLLDKI
ncbi:MAG TPA: MAPEG family protein [Steroidobacteraceae bacterium]|nr:MAPEG family protein [Steroidobacteraceae bacterium]